MCINKKDRNIEYIRNYLIYDSLKEIENFGKDDSKKKHKLSVIWSHCYSREATYIWKKIKNSIFTEILNGIKWVILT